MQGCLCPAAQQHPLARAIYFCHHPLQIGFEEWLADQRESVAVALTAGQKDDVEAIAKAARVLCQFSSVKPGMLMSVINISML